MSQNQNREERREQFNKEYGKREVTVIPAKPEFTVNVEDRQEMVGPYSRVSTMSGEQVESFETQKRYYVEYIAQHPNWTMVDMYADEGISATSTAKRKDFLRLVQDCKDGKVSLILTKTVTRFARNVVDCIQTCRMLKSLTPPVGVFFEADGIHTLAQNSELHLNLLAVLAQSESETKSAAIKWALRKRFQQGIPRIVDLYGYKRTNKRELTIDPEQAAVVKAIYEWYLAGNSISYIIRMLHQQGIRSPTGLDEWSYSTILYILTNEKYAGNVIMQKTCTVDMFSHKSVKNNGRENMYRIDNYHAAIIPEEQWLQAQSRIFTCDWKNFIDRTIEVHTSLGGMYPLSLNNTKE